MPLARRADWPYHGLVLQRIAVLIFGLAWGAAVVAAEPTSVVIELFTSEGCPKCPQADNLLRDLARSQPLEGIEIVPIALHVDFFDTEGWVDPYSQPWASLRQRRYAVRDGAPGWFTPQFFIGGGPGFNGGRIDVLRGVLYAAGKPQAGLAWSEDGTALRVESLPEGIDEVELALIVTEHGLNSGKITGGENEGSVLRHAAVARDWIDLGSVAAADLPSAHSFTADVDPTWNREQLQVVAIAQVPGQGTIVGTAAAPLPASFDSGASGGSDETEAAVGPTSDD